jgi:hypothetical protein
MMTVFPVRQLPTQSGPNRGSGMANSGLKFFMSQPCRNSGGATLQVRGTQSIKSDNPVRYLLA